jgi:hypothetical protein
MFNLNPYFGFIVSCTCNVNGTYPPIVLFSKLSQSYFKNYAKSDSVNNTLQVSRLVI